MLKAFTQSSSQSFSMMRLVSHSQIRQGKTCPGHFRNLYTNRLQQHPSKLPRVYGISMSSRCYSFKSAVNYVRWTVSQILEHVESVAIKTPLGDVHGKLPKSFSIMQFKPMLPQLPNHEVIDRPQEMKKLKEAYQSVEKRKLDYQPEVIYLKGEPGVGKTQLARMFAENYYEGMSKTDTVVATIDMTDFSNDYRKVAIKLGIDPDLADGLPLKRVAEEMKNILAEKKNKWFLIIDNYNSAQQLGFERDDLERNLLPLHGLTDKWENGKVLVTTSNAGVIPQNNIDTVSTVGIEPLSIEESAKLIGRLAGYNLNEREKESLKAAVNTKQWRCLPLIMAGIGEYICMRRKQTARYNFDDYVEELEKGEVIDPQTSRERIRNIYLPIQTMMTTSPTLKLAFRLLALCPESSKVPLVLFERLMKKYFREEWAQRLMELESCTIIKIAVEHESELPKQYDVKHKFLTVHRLHQQAMLQVTMHLPADQVEDLIGSKHLITDFINCIISEYEEACSSSDSIHAMKMPHTLFKLLTGLDQMNDKHKIFPPDVKVDVDCVLSDAHLRLMAQPREALEKLKPYYNERGLGPESDDISVHIVSPEGLITNDAKTAVATKVYLHLGKIFREQGEYQKASKVLMTALQPLYCQTSNSDQVSLILKEKAKLALILGDYGTAKDHLNQVLQLYKDQEPTLKSEVHTLLAKVYSKQFVCEEAEKHYKEALQIIADTKIPTILAADVEMNLGDICSDQGNYKKALGHLQKSQMMLAKVRDSNQAQELFLPIAIRFTKMALCHLYSGRNERADKEAKWALSTTSKLPWTQNSALYSWIWGLQRVADVNRLLDVQRYIEKHPADYVPERLKFVQSKVNYMVGNVKEGEQLMREFIFNTDESDVEVLAKTAFHLKHPLRELGMMYFHLGEYQQSLNVLNRARELQEQTKLPDTHSEVCFVKAHLGRIHYEAGNKRGLQMTQEAVQNLEINPMLSKRQRLPYLLRWTKAQRMRPFNENHKNLGLHLKHSAVLTLHGMLLNKNSKWSDAQDVLKKALDTRETLLSPNNIYTARTVAALGMAEYHLGNKLKGKRLLSKAAMMTNMSNQFYPRHILGAYVHLTYAQVLKDDGDFQEAAKQAKNAIECIDYACQTDTHPKVAECHLLLATMQNNILEQRHHLIKARNTYKRLVDREIQYCKRQGLDPSSIEHLKTWHKLKTECDHRLSYMKSSQ